MSFIIGFFAVSVFLFWLMIIVFLIFWFLSKEMDYMIKPLTEQEWSESRK